MYGSYQNVKLKEQNANECIRCDPIFGMLKTQAEIQFYVLTWMMVTCFLTFDYFYCAVLIS